MVLCCSLPSFHFDVKDSLKYFLQGRSNDVKLSQLLFIWESFNFCFIFLKDNFASYSTSGWQYFSFSTLKLLCHSTLAWEDSDEKFVKSDFYVSTFKIFSLMWLSTVCRMYLSMGLFGFSLAEVYWASWALFFPQIWGVWGHFIFK